MNPGDVVGPYRVVGKLGEGGMGEVYRARDARLSRDVAIKALPAAGAADPDRTARFEREAQVLGGLNHPHIAALFGLERSGASQFLVMELVEGGTLAERLESGPLSVRDAAEISRQIADALQAAHDRGVIHRDLKPANIGFTADGHVKVLDFGLAKIKDPIGATSGAAETVAAATRTGVVMGTAAYMSPEQARGQTLDKRSDIFAFGCVLFEMLTAGNPFSGASISDILVAILERDPDWSLLPATTPPRLQWLLRRCLEKDPRRRLQDIGDARIELDEVIAGRADSAPVSPATIRSPRGPRTRERLAWTIAALAIVALAAILILRDRPAAPGNEPLIHAALQLPRLSSVAGPDSTPRVAISPDGRKIAFVGAGQDAKTMLWVRSLDAPVAQPLAGTDNSTNPFWSPDSRSIGYILRGTAETTSLSGKLMRVAAAGGQPVTLADVAFAGIATWGAAGDILYTPSGQSPLHRVSADGGPSSEATRLDKARGHVQHSHPFFLPDGRRFLYTAFGTPTGATSPTGVYVASLDARDPPRLLLEGVTQASFARGHLFYLQDETLIARPFDVSRLEFTGTASPVADQVVTSGVGGGLVGAHSVSAAGLIAYQAPLPVRTQLTWYDRGGTATGTLGSPGDWVDVALSPDGTRLVSSLTDTMARRRSLWMLDVRRGLADRFTSAAEDYAPVWEPNGESLVFSSVRDGGVNLYRKSTSGGAEQRVDDGGLIVGKYAASWSPDGQKLLFIAGGRTIARSDLMLLPAGGGTPETFADSPSVETQARFAPDGRWIAYASNTPGRLELYVKPYGRPGQPRRVSDNGGRFPRWRRDQKEIIFVDKDDMLASAAVVVTNDDVTVGEIRPLFQLKLRPQVRLDSYPYDMTPDASQFVVNTFVETIGVPNLLTLILNWPGGRNQ